jgi:hypothetical protein
MNGEEEVWLHVFFTSVMKVMVQLYVPVMKMSSGTVGLGYCWALQLV